MDYASEMLHHLGIMSLRVALFRDYVSEGVTSFGDYDSEGLYQ